MTVREIKIKNKKILTLLEEVQNKDFDEKTPCLPRGFELENYDSALQEAVKDETLFDYLKFQKPILKIKFNKLIAETEAGVFFDYHLRKMLSYAGFYSSCYMPRGFDRWHEDREVGRYVFLFTYSKQGNGYFKYKNPHEFKTTTLHDTTGWMVRGMDNGVDDTDKLWHCVASEGFRATFILTFNDDINNYNKAVELIMRE